MFWIGVLICALLADFGSRCTTFCVLIVLELVIIV